MPLTIPKPIVALPGGAALPIQPSLAFNDPSEGRRYIPVEILWPGNGTTFQLNAQGITTQPFSQIVMLDVDNTRSGADVSFLFLDSGDTLDVPAGSGGLFPVFTNQLNMYVAAPAAIATDVTRFRMLNYRQDPVGLPPPQMTTVAAASGFGAPGTTALLAPGISGTLRGYSLTAAAVSDAAVLSAWNGTLVSHTGGAILDQFLLRLPANSSFNGLLWNVTNCAIRFAGGLDLTTITNTFTAQPVGNISLRYTTP